MISRQIDVVWIKICTQARTIFLKPYRGRLKRQFIDQFTDKIEGVVPGVSREDIAIISTGLLAELRMLKDPLLRDRVITEGGHDEAL